MVTRLAVKMWRHSTVRKLIYDICLATSLTHRQIKKRDNKKTAQGSCFEVHGRTKLGQVGLNLDERPWERGC